MAKMVRDVNPEPSRGHIAGGQGSYPSAKAAGTEAVARGKIAGGEGAQEKDRSRKPVSFLVRRGQVSQEKEPHSPGAPAAPLKSWAKLDQLIIPDWASKLPDGRSVHDVDPNEFSRAVNKLNLGLDQSLGHQDRVKQYIDRLTSIFNDAGKLAVEAWLRARQQL